MTIFEKFRQMNIAHRKNDEALYSIVSQEMEAGIRHDGLWLKALEHGGGNKEKQISEYIKLRIQSLKDDINITSNSSKTVKRILYDRDIEEFVTVLSDGSSLDRIEAFFSEMRSQEIHKFINQPDACDDYPIHIAIKKGRVDIAKWLLTAGANPLLKNYWGKTALEIAVQKKDQDAITLLQQHVG